MTYEEFKKRYIYDIHTNLLGEGGFGRVYKAYDCYEHEDVALKMQSVSPNHLELRLRNEVDKVAQYVHKNIARYKTCYTFPSADGELDVAVMKYYNDGNLHSLMRSGLLGNVERSSMLREILDGIAFLHSHNIIHRDLKPQNILVVKYQNEYCPLITDFGISKKLEVGQSSSVFNSFMGGTFEYASPEQLAERSIRKNVDLWSFGVIAYQMFTGELPFNCGNFNPTSKEGYAELFRQISSGVLPDKVNSIPEPWQTIVRRCIVVDNEVRLAHAEDCLRILDNYTKTDSGDTVGSVEVVDVVTPEPTPVQPPKPEPKPEPRVEPKPAETPKTPTPPAPKKSGKVWLWIVLALLLVGCGIGGWYLYNENKKQQREESVIELLSGEEVNDENLENQILISEDTNVLKSGVVACNTTIDSSGRVVMCSISSQGTTTIDHSLRAMCIEYIKTQHFPVKTEGQYVVICNVKQYGSGEYKCEVQSIMQKHQTQSTTPQNTNEDSIRIAEEKRIAEQKAQEEAARKAEQQRIAEQQAQEEAARIAEEKRIAEQKAQEEAARKAEQQRIDNMVAQGLGRDGVYQVGDYYNRDGKQGVVFEVWNGGRNGKIVSLDEAEKQWCTESQYKKYIVTGVKSETDGKANTDRIMSRSDSSQYPAFVWCRNKGNGWYLPAKDELKAIYKAKYKINNTMSNCGGESIRTTNDTRNTYGPVYWTSTEDDSNDELSAWYVIMRTGDTCDCIKHFALYVRAVSAF